MELPGGGPVRLPAAHFRYDGSAQGMGEDVPELAGGHSRVRATNKMKTFIVQIATSRRIVSWPLRRLDVSETALTARAWPSWYMRARTVAKHSVRVINVRQSLGGMVLTVDDEVGSFSNLRFLVQLKATTSFARS